MTVNFLHVLLAQAEGFWANHESIYITCLLDSGWILKEQVTCESLLGVKGLSILLFCKQVELSLYFNMFFCVILQFPS